MNELLIDLADALDDTRAGTDRRSAKLAEEARALAKGPLAICAIGTTGSGKTTALEYIAADASLRGFEASIVGGHNRERVAFDDAMNAVDAFWDKPCGDRVEALTAIEIPMTGIVRILDIVDDKDPLVHRLAEAMADADGLSGSDRSDGNYMELCRRNVLAILRALPAALAE